MAKRLIIETVTASTHANKGSIIIMLMPINIRLIHPHHEPFSSLFSFIASFDFLMQIISVPLKWDELNN